LLFDEPGIFEQLATVSELTNRMSVADSSHVVKRRLSVVASGAVEASSAAGPRKKKRESEPVPAVAERSSVKLVGEIGSLSQGSFIARHRLWCTKWGGNIGLCPRREHSVLSLALDAAVSSDGLDIRNLKFAEILLRRKQEIEQAVSGVEEDFCPETCPEEDSAQRRISAPVCSGRAVRCDQASS
jgi:hypothetical protein